MKLKVKKALAIMMAWLMVFNMIPLQALAAEDSVSLTEEEPAGTVDEEISETASETVESADAETTGTETAETEETEAAETAESGSVETETEAVQESISSEAEAGTEEEVVPKSTESETVPPADAEASVSVIPEAGIEKQPAEVSMPAFEPDTVVIDGVAVTVSAPEGVFPEGAALSVKKVAVWERGKVEEAVGAERDTNVNVAVSYTFDITVLDADGNEIQPTDGSKVKVSFALAEVADENLHTNVYHVSENEQTGELEAEALNVTQEITEETGEATTATVETDGFSFYTVEFTYEQKQYVMNGDTTVALADILDYVGLTGTATAVEVSDSTLFSASDESGEWMVTAHQAFHTNEWMKVTIDGVEYEITVTDAQVSSNISTGATYKIDGSSTYSITIPKTSGGKYNCVYSSVYDGETNSLGSYSATSNFTATIDADGTLHLKDNNFSLGSNYNAWRVGYASEDYYFYRAYVKADQTWTISAVNSTYTGSSVAGYTLSGTTKGNLTLAYSGDGITGTTSTAPINVGSYHVKVTYSGDNSYNSRSQEVDFSITKANISPSVTMSGWTYGNTASNPSVSGNPGNGTATYQYKVSTAADSTYTSTKPSTPGTYTVKANIAATTSYNSGTATTNFTISKATNPITYADQTWSFNYSTTAQTKTLNEASNAQGTVTYSLLSQKNGTTTVSYFSFNATTRVLTAAANTPVGTYTVAIRASAAGNGNYNGGTKDSTVTVTISKTTNPLSFTATQSVSKIYNTASQTATLTAASGGQGTVSYAINSQKNSSSADVSFFLINGTTLTIAANTPVGTYTVVVRATAAGNGNYNSGTKDSTVTVTVGKASITPSVTMEDWTYGGTASNPSISGNSGNGSVTYTYKVRGAADSTYDSTKPSAAGTYTVKAVVAETANYNGGTATADFTIERAPITPSITITGWTYGYTANAPVVTGNTGNGGETIRYTNHTGTADYDSPIVPTNAGDYKVTVTIAQTDNYLGKSASADFTIARQNINPTFDPDHLENCNVEFLPVTVPNGVTPTVTLRDALGNIIPTTEYKVATNGVDHEVNIQDKLTGTGTTGYGNYNIATSDIAYPFEPGTATVTTVPRAATLTYNGADQSLLATAGAAANGSMAYALGTNDTTAPASGYVTDYTALTGKDAGDYYVWYKAVGDGTNYHDSDPVCLRVTISKAALTVTANAKTISYGDAPANAGVTYDGFQGDETATVLSGTLTFSYTYSQGGDVNAVGSETYNNFAIIPSGYTSNNYNIHYVNGTLRVNKKPVDITITTADKVYDGTSSAAANASFAAADTVVTGDDLRIQNGTAEFSDANVGTGKTVTFSGFALAGDSVGNYLLNSCTATATADITAKDVTVTGIRAFDKVYDGTAVAEMNYGSVSFTGLVAGEDLAITVTGTFSDANVGEGKTVSITDAALVNGTNGLADNYHLTAFNTTTTADITARPITITAGSDTKTYDGTALTRNTYAVIYTGDATKTALATGDALEEVTISGSQTAAGSSDNTASGAVIKNNNGSGVDVTANYQITYGKGTLTVDRKAVTITASGASKTYDGTALTESGFTASDLEAGDSHVFTVVMTEGSTITKVGTQPNVIATVDGVAVSTESATEVGNYLVTIGNGTLTINAKAVTITASNASKVYDGTALTQSGFTATTLAEGDSIESVTVTGSQLYVGTSSNVPSAAVIKNSNNEDVTASYAITYANGTLEVTQKPITITADSDTKIYDGSALTKDSYTNTALATGDSIASVTITGSQTNVGSANNVPSAAEIRNGDVDVTADYDITYVNGTLEVTAKTVTVKANDAGKTYGEDDPALSATVTGLVGNDTVNYTIARATGEDAGEYTITPGGEATQGNYRVTYETGTFTVSRADLSLVVTMSGWTYGTDASIPSVEGNAGDGAVTYSYKVKGAEDSTYTSVKPSTVGDYTVRAVVAQTQNYNIATATTDFTISPATIRMTVAGYTGTYDGEGHGITVDVTAPASGAVVTYGTTEGTYDLTANPTYTDAGTYTVYYQVAADNYTTVTGSATVTINTKALTVTADAQSKTYGEADPALTYTTEGLVAGDSVTGALTRAAGENVGTYEIGQGTLTAGANYVISYTAALLTINKANADTTAPTANALTYDGTAQALVTAGTPTGGALVYSTDGVTYSETIPTAKNAGQHTVYYKVTGDSNHNDKEAQTVTVTILAKTLTVTADAKSKGYGGEDPAFTYTSAGLVEGDSITGALSRTAGENVGAYPITQGTLTAGDNYSITYIGANLTITKADASVTTAPTAKTLTYTGAAQALVNEGTANGGTMMYALAADSETAPAAEAYSVSVPAAVNAGTYTVYYKAAGDSNHTDTEAAQAVVTIQRKELAVVADAQSKTYGTSDPELTFTYEGLAEGDAFSGQLSRESGENIGQYEISQGTLSAGTNYSITYTGAFLTIDKADSVITAVPTAKTLTYTGAAQELVNAGNTADGTMYYALGEADGVADFDGTSESANKKWSTAIPAVKTSGTYHVWYMAVGDSNHNNTMPVHITVSVGKKEIGIDWSDQDLTYNQTAQKPSAATETGSLAEGDDVTVIVSGEQTNANTAVTPSYTATAVLAGTDAGNYQIKADQQMVTFTISPKALMDGMLMLADTSYVHDGEAKTPVITVKDGGITLTAGQDYTVDTTSTLSSADYGTYEILVTGKGNYTGGAKQAWEITDDKAPDIEIKVETSTFKSFLNTVSFGLFFNRTETVTVTAADAGSGVDKVYYITSGTSVSTVEELVTLAGDDWTEIKNGGSFSKDPEAKYIVYAKAVDNAGNVNYASSEGIVLDAVKPVVEVAGSSVKQEYNKSVTWTASDDYLKSVVITFIPEGETAENEIYHKDTAVEQTLLAGESALSDLGSYTIKAVDKAGNETVETFTITRREAEISGSEKSAVFEEGKTYDLSQLFSVEEGVAISTYEIVANADESIAAGAGTIAGDQLTITKAGLFTIRATIAKGVTDTEAKEYVKETTGQAKLTVGRADGVAGITVADVVYGRGLTVVTSSSTNAGAAPAVTYTMIADAAGAEIAEADRTTSETKPVLVGTYKAVVSYAATGLYNAAGAETTFKIMPAVLNVTADAKEKPYGSSDPALTYTVTGLAYEDVAETVITGTLGRTEGENVGVYEIQQGTLRSNSNYTISYTGANLTISKAAVEVKTIAVPVEVSCAGVQNKIIDLKEYLVTDAALAQTEAADGTPGGAKIELTGELADYITVGEMIGTEFSFNVMESESGSTGQMILTITSPNYADYKLIIDLVSARKVTQVVVESEDVEETAVETVEVPALEEFTEAQPEATVEVKMEVKLESEETVEKELGTAGLTKIKDSIAKAFGGVANSDLSQEYLDITVTKSVNGGAAQEISDVNRVLEIAVGYDLTGKYNPIIIREHNGAVSRFTKLNSRPAAGSYRDGTFYVSGSGKSGVIYIYARYFSTYTVAYTTAASYQVTFDDATGDEKAGSQSNIEQVIVETGAKVVKPADPKRDGYDFEGWYIEGTNTKWDFDTAVTGDITLVAHWDEEDDDEEEIVPAPAPVVTEAPRSPKTGDVLPNYVLWMMIVAAGLSVGGSVVWGRRKEQE